MGSRNLAGACLLCLVACASPAAPETGHQPDAQPPAPPAEEQTSAPSTPPSTPAPFTAVLRIDPHPGGKRFQGVWLETDDGERLLVAYRARPWWKPFEGRTVEATGERYQPSSHQQQIGAPHFRVEGLRILAPTPEDTLVSIGAEQELTGAFRDKAAPAESKLGTSRVFAAADGTEYQLGNAIAAAPLRTRVKIKARTIELSNFVARPGGPHLWVIDVVETP